MNARVRKKRKSQGMWKEVDEWERLDFDLQANVRASQGQILGYAVRITPLMRRINGVNIQMVLTNRERTCLTDPMC